MSSMLRYQGNVTPVSAACVSPPHNAKGNTDIQLCPTGYLRAREGAGQYVPGVQLIPGQTKPQPQVILWGHTTFNDPKAGTYLEHSF